MGNTVNVVEMAKAAHINDEKKAMALHEKWRNSMQDSSPKKLITEARRLLSKADDSAVQQIFYRVRIRVK